MNKLTFTKKLRQGYSSQDISKEERDYFDFLIDNIPLSEILSVGDKITPLGWSEIKFQKDSVMELLKQKKSELTSGRVPVYICPECGDLGCGAVTVNIIENENSFVWKDFGYENNYEDVLHPIDFLKDSQDSFEFFKDDYKSALEGIISN